MTVNPKTLELRNLIDAPTGSKCCSICGKPEARASKEVKALPHHSAAILAELPARFRNFTKAVGSNLMDFVTRERFNAELENIREKLTAAREEHDAYQPEKPETDKAKTARLLAEMLALVGKPVQPNPDPASKGEWQTLTLIDALHHELRKLMEIKAEVAAIEQAA